MLQVMLFWSTPNSQGHEQSMTNKILEKNLIRERVPNCGGALQIFKAVWQNHLLSLKLLASKISGDGYTNRSQIFIRLGESGFPGG